VGGEFGKVGGKSRRKPQRRGRDQSNPRRKPEKRKTLLAIISRKGIPAPSCAGRTQRKNGRERDGRDIVAIAEPPLDERKANVIKLEGKKKLGPVLRRE